MCKNKGGVKFSPVLVDWEFAGGWGEGALSCLLLYCQFRIACLEAALERLTPSSFCHKWHHVMSLMSKGFKIATMLSPQYVISEEKQRSIWAFFFFFVDSLFVSSGFHLCFRRFTYFLDQVGLILGQKFVLCFFCLETCWVALCPSLGVSGVSGDHVVVVKGFWILLFDRF